MSLPLPCTVHTPLVTLWLPASGGAPMSVQVQFAGQTGGGGRLSVTLSKVAPPVSVVLCAVTASPASTVLFIVMVTVEPGISVQAVPLADVYAVNVLPTRVTLKYCGTVPASAVA